jgi:hypothetical protein
MGGFRLKHSALLSTGITENKPVVPTTRLYAIIRVRSGHQKRAVRKGNRADMSGFEPLGKLLIFAGVFIIVLGLLVMFWSKIPFLGKLPGDILLQKEGFQFFFPIVTCLLISVILTVVINLVMRLLGR